MVVHKKSKDLKSFVSTIIIVCGQSISQSCTSESKIKVFVLNTKMKSSEKVKKKRIYLSVCLISAWESKHKIIIIFTSTSFSFLTMYELAGNTEDSQ